MEILDLLTLVFCVLAVTLNAAACLVLLKRKSGKTAPAYSLIFATLAFIFIIIGCLGYLFSDYAIAMPATLVLSGLCLLVYFAVEKPPAPRQEASFDSGQGRHYGVADFDFSEMPSSEDDSQLGDDYGTADFGFSEMPSFEDDSRLDDNYGADLESSSEDFSTDSLDDIDFSELPSIEDDLQVGDDFSMDLESSSEDFSEDDLGFSADDLDDFDLDFSLDMGLDDDDFDAVFPPDDDALLVDALLDDDVIAASPEQEAADELSDDAVLDEEFEAEFEFPQEDEAAADSSIEEGVAFEGADTIGDALGLDEASALLESEAAADSFDEAEEDRVLKAGQLLIEQVSQSMRGGIDLDAILDFANRSLIENTGADGGIIFLIDDSEDVLNTCALSGQFPPPYRLPDDLPRTQEAVEAALRHARLSLSGNVFGEAALSGEAIVIDDGAADERVYQNGDEDFLALGSYIIAPLSVNDKVLGIAGLSRLPQREPFSQKNFKTAKALAGYAAATVSNVYSFQAILERAVLESDVDAAAKIQKTFLPKKLPELAEAGFGFFFQEAEGVCTDYCDVIFARRDRIALVVADVAGKGIISGMIMTSLRALLHLVTNTTKSASTILDWVNKSIADKNIDIDHYAALSYVSYSLETNELEYASAGNQSMLLWRAAESRAETVRIEAEPLGVDRGIEYKEKKLTAAPGDIILLFTDGLVDALSPQGAQYGVDGLSKALADNSDASAKDIAAAIKRDINDFTGSAAPHDDQTLLVLKIQNL